MTEAYATYHIPKRMRELGYCGYFDRYHTYRVEAGATKEIDAGSDLYFLISPDAAFIVKSRAGIYDTNNPAVNDLTYEHRKKITIQNTSDTAKFITFIQVIPQNRIKKKNHD